MDCDFVPQPTTNFHLYNDSDLFSLGSRLLVLKYSENEDEYVDVKILIPQQIHPIRI